VVIKHILKNLLKFRELIKMKIYCPHCGGEINPASLLGKISTDKKKKTSAENGKKGGRPKKKPEVS
jgi:hypothetical protein